MNYTIKTFIASGGERFSQLYAANPSGFPLFQYKLLVYTPYCNCCLPYLQWSLEKKTKSLEFKMHAQPQGLGTWRRLRNHRPSSGISSRYLVFSILGVRPKN
jgi:hypothetical protein